jgi:hypothetical protein
MKEATFEHLGWICDEFETLAEEKGVSLDDASFSYSLNSVTATWYDNGEIKIIHIVEY